MSSTSTYEQLLVENCTFQNCISSPVSISSLLSVYCYTNADNSVVNNIFTNISGGLYGCIRIAGSFNDFFLSNNTFTQCSSDKGGVIIEGLLMLFIYCYL
jgi:hypothetical protein